jgi:Spy/CpxP family protein refolding chaperone
MKKALLISFAALLMLAPAAFADHGRGCGPGHGPGHGDGPGMGMMGMRTPGIQMILRHADDINLTDEQKTKLEAMRAEFQIERIDQKAELEKAQVRSHTLMMDDAPEAEVLRAIDEVTRLQGEMKKMMYSHHQAVKAVLTDAQIDQLKELRAERRFDGRDGKRMRDGDGPHGNRGRGN